jgi:hypothetical protein
MTYQDVRGYFEKACYTALTTAGIPAADISFDNYYAIVALSFGNTVEDTLSCEGLERLRGSLQVIIYTPKQKGSKPGEDIALAVLKAWNAINAIKTFTAPLLNAACSGIEGPTTLAPDQRPHHINVVSCAFKARVS